MGPEYVTVLAGGMVWSAWEYVEVNASFQDAARSFRIDAAAEAGPSAVHWTFRTGTEVSILFNGALACRGYVDRLQPKLSRHKQAIFTVSGRSKSQDMIDCSAVHDTGHFRDKTPQEIGAELDKFGVGIRTDETLDKVPVYRLTPGESAFRVIEKLCREQGVFPVGQADGSILITKGGKARHVGALVEGVNILAIDADHNAAGRHSEIIVRGQRPLGHGSEVLEIEGKASDSGVSRYRPVVVFHDGDTDKGRAKKRAKHRRDREAGNGLKANVEVQGFHDAGGKLWTPGHLIFTESEFAGIAQDMAVESVLFMQARGDGSLAKLSLVDPRALGGKGAKGGKSNSAWQTDAGEG